MRFTTTALAAAAVSSVVAQRPDDTSICDYYTTALFQDNTADNQYTLLTALVNTVVIGNYTQPNVGIVVPGILAPGTYEGTDVNLAPYFDGTLNTTNRDGRATSVNFLDGGGAAPLQENKPAEDENSNQYRLMTHLYQFFGTLLGCTMQGMPGFAPYAGDPSMFKVHKFMGLDEAQNGYFIQQVALAAASFGVAESDITAVGEALQTRFGLRCAPPVEVIPDRGEELQAICIVQSCPLAPEAVCGLYEAELAGGDDADDGEGEGEEGMPTMTASATSAVSTAGAAATGFNVAAAAVGLAALLL